MPKLRQAEKMAGTPKQKHNRQSGEERMQVDQYTVYGTGLGRSSVEKWQKYWGYCRVGGVRKKPGDCGETLQSG